MAVALAQLLHSLFKQNLVNPSKIIFVALILLFQ